VQQSDDGACEATVSFSFDVTPGGADLLRVRDTTAGTTLLSVTGPLQQTYDVGPVAFPHGSSTVVIELLSGSSVQTSATFDVTVEDPQPPVLSGPSSVTLVTDCEGSTLTLTPASLGLSATDCGDVTLSLDPSSVAPGTTTVVGTAVDDEGNESQKSIEVTVLSGPFDVRFKSPLDAGADNEIKVGKTVNVKVTVHCGNVFESDATVTIDSIARLGSTGTPVGSESGGGSAMELKGNAYQGKLSTTGWTNTQGTRFRVRVKVVKAGHVDTFADVILVAR
jgi:hypothetical protein